MMMKRIPVVASLLVFAAPVPAQQDTAFLRFSDYSVDEVFTGKPKPVDLSSDPEARRYRTVLRRGAKEGPNFAGHYTIVIWGCGTSTQQFAMLDALTGKVYFADNLAYVSYADWKAEPYGLQFKRNSKLLAVYGRLFENDPKGIFFFLWENNKLRLLKTLPKDN